MKSGIDDQVQYIVFNFRFRVSGELNIKITIIVIATAAAMQSELCDSSSFLLLLEKLPIKP